MYQVGDLIVYGSTGVCRVEAIAPGGQGRDYYTLQPLYQSCTIMTPVDNTKVFMRPIISKADALALIDRIPLLSHEAFHARAPRELSEYYDGKLKAHDCQSLAELAMSIYTKREEAQAQKRRLGSVDESYFRRAEELLHCELAAALGIDKDQVAPFIARRVASGAEPCESPAD